MTRFFLSLALLYLVVHFVRRLLQPIFHGEERAPESRERPIVRGMPRAVVCGECGTQFEPSKDGWTCPRCGQ